MPKKKTTRSAKRPSPVPRIRSARVPKSMSPAQARVKAVMGSGSRNGSGSLGGSGSGFGCEPHPHHCKFFPKGQPLPVDVTLRFDAPLEGGNETGRHQLNRPTLLIHAQDPAFACCWFSRAIDLGDECGNPAFWMLQKTANDEWLLCLRRVSGQLVAYHLKSKSSSFSLTLKKGEATKDFKWPRSITICAGVH